MGAHFESGLDLFGDEAASDPRVRLRPERRSAEALIELLKRDHRARIAGEVVAPERHARHAGYPETLDPRLRAALEARGIRDLYSHQREAWAHVAAGHDTVVVTPTASGKTLCYNLPVIDAALKTGAKALYLFPTKALSQDQVGEILELNAAGRLGVRAYTFDGDTPGDARRAVRTHGDIVVSNPDMLHQAILPHHTKWAQFFEDAALRGDRRTAHLPRRVRFARRERRASAAADLPVLRRRSRCSSPARRRSRTPPSWRSASSAARCARSPSPARRRAGKHFLVWNPPVLNADLGIRASARSQSTRIARLAVKLGLKTIVFANSRLEVEVLTKYLKDAFDGDPREPARVAAYRGGYLPTERRDKEAKLRAGRLDCVVATSALELGVDIGALDVCVLNGYPGTVAGSRQRFGRAGRRNRTAVGVLVCTSDPLDQYLVAAPGLLPRCERPSTRGSIRTSS